MIKARPVLVRRVWIQHELVLDVPGCVTLEVAEAELGSDYMHGPEVAVEFYSPYVDQMLADEIAKNILDDLNSKGDFNGFVRSMLKSLFRHGGPGGRLSRAINARKGKARMHANKPRQRAKRAGQ